MRDLIEILSVKEDSLVEKVVDYAIKHNYAKYTSTLKEAWRISIAGLSEAITRKLLQNPSLDDLIDINSKPLDEQFVQFGILEAKKHRERGITLQMFIGLFKYYKYSYEDLIREEVLITKVCNFYLMLIARIFDHIEVVICKSWEMVNQNKLVEFLQMENRQLANQKNKYITILESIPIPVILLDSNKEIENFNFAASCLFEAETTPGKGYYGKSSIRNSLSWLVHELDNLSWESRQIIVEKEIETIDGNSTYEVRITPVLDISEKYTGFVIVLNNISKAKKIEEAHDFYLKLLNDFPTFIWRTDKIGKINYINSRLKEFIGLSNEPKEVEAIICFHPSDQDRMVIELNNLLKSKQPFEMEFRVRRYDGEYVWLLNIGRPYKDINGNFAGYINLSYDISDRKFAIDNLRRSEEEYRLLIDHSPDTILIHDGETIIFANSRASRLFGNQNVIGSSIYSLIHPESLLTVKERIRQSVENGKVAKLMELKIIRPDGVSVDVEVVSIPVTYQGKRRVQTIFRDITGRKQQEQEIMRNSKLESLGLLAGGIAHDFNNILTIILGNVSLARYVGKFDDKTSSMLEEIEKASLQARGLTNQLLTFSRGGAPQKRVVNISHLLKEAVNFALSGSNIRAELNIPENLWAVSVDENQINQVINNIVINAKEAMPEGGTLNVSAQNISDLRKQTKCVQILFSDEGIGIPSEIILQVFDPYFTTKNNGSGLGLTTTYSIIKKHSGNISVESTLGKGTTIKIILPTSEFSEHHHIKEADHYSLGVGRILIMDDEANIRDILGKMLSQLGYSSDFASEGAEMLTKYKDNLIAEKPYKAVIMDLTIPGGMGGKQAIKELLSLDPKAYVIVSSGYSDDPVISQYKDFGFKGHIAKPYSLKELSNVLNIHNDSAIAES